MKTNANQLAYLQRFYLTGSGRVAGTNRTAGLASTFYALTKRGLIVVDRVPAYDDNGAEVEHWASYHNRITPAGLAALGVVGC